MKIFLTVHRQQLQQQKEQHGENIGVTNKKKAAYDAAATSVVVDNFYLYLLDVSVFVKCAIIDHVKIMRVKQWQ